MMKKIFILPVLAFSLLSMLCSCATVYQDHHAKSVHAAMMKVQDPVNIYPSLKSMKLVFENQDTGSKTECTLKKDGMLYMESTDKNEKTPFLVYGLKNKLLWEKTPNRPSRLIYDDEFRNSFLFLYDSTINRRSVTASISYAGTDYVGSILCDKLLVTLKPKYSITTVTMYISRENKLCLKTVCMPDPHAPFSQWTTTYEDYKSFDGLMLPTRITTDFEGTAAKYILKSAELNQEYPDSLFEFKE